MSFLWKTQLETASALPGALGSCGSVSPRDPGCHLECTPDSSPHPKLASSCIK